ncbi:MAG: heparan-alpha-glucosaminide N-acetyltransferase domain-containing protein [Planctomycetes bacterium]|nr:heparan-alpha-glucosaminide N-acetyltransferase domain-containing protein [Planctomycetota bacterium]
MPDSSPQHVPPDSSFGDSRTGRLLSLDAFRGLTILAMILVNNPGTWGAMYWPLAHAEWHGWTPTDLIFPFFLFIVGTSLAYSLRKYTNPPLAPPYKGGESGVPAAVYWRIVRRTGLLIFLGWLPGLLFRTIGYFSGDASSLDLETFRVPGVLVRIGLVYFCASMIVLHVSLRGQIVLGIALLLGYWGLLAWLPNPHDYGANLSRDGNLVGLVDRSTIGQNHMYRQGGKTDPEGLLSTLPAIVTSLLGYWTGLFVQRRGVSYRTVALLAAGGLACAAVGQSWDLLFPINKKIWTSSFVLLTGGLAMVVLAGCLLKFDIWGWRRLARPYEIVGINAIFVFVGSGLLATALSRWQIANVSAHDWLFGKITAALSNPPIASLGWDWIADPKFASLCYALAIVSFWWLVCWLMSRLGWQIRV